MRLKPSRYSHLILLAAIAVVTCSCARDAAADKKGAGQKKRAAAPVRVAQVERRDVPFEVRAVGNAEAVSVVAIKSRVAGQLIKMHVREGEDVKAGALLLEIDPLPFFEQVRAAEATLARDQALEKQAMAEIERAKAQAANARAQWERYQQLLKEGIAARQQADEFRTAAAAADAQLNAVRASLESARAAIRTDEARLAQVKLELGYTKIYSPVTGAAGFIAIKAGNLVKENDSVSLVNIAQVSPMYVSFAVPEQYLPDIRRYGFSGAKLPVDALNEAGAVLAQGMLEVIDNAVDTTTGTIKLKASFPNQDRRLWPGQFVSVRVRLRVDAGALTLPNSAVNSGAEGRFVWIVRGDRTAEMRKVAVARVHNDRTILSDGVQEGETVVTSGQLRVASGAPVQVLP
ncbi:MAG TPA: efflux RND transporter periplasmic adaptor subunit [Solibacterales bacterium]|nr:efflux RND transporter periplasmic adaptor subunit [Bryobacterales bacterium]